MKVSNREENIVQCQIRNRVLSRCQIRNFLLFFRVRRSVTGPSESMGLILY
jgi:hypothetical protein